MATITPISTSIPPHQQSISGGRREELEKLTVAQLKERLKGRKLPISGTKAELVARLCEDIAAEEEKLLGGAGQEGHPLDLVDFNTLDVDAVLGIPGTESTTPLSHSPAKSQQQQVAFTTSAAKEPLRQQQPAQAVPATTTSPGKASAGPGVTTAEKDGNPHATLDEAQAKVAAAKISTKPSSSAAAAAAGSDNARLTAVSRLGLPISAESEARAKRASRFASGGAGDVASPATATAANTTTGDANASAAKKASEEEARAKRLARFGTASITGPDGGSSDSTNPAAPPAANGGASSGKPRLSTEEGGKMLERAKRFGLPLGTGAGSGNGEVPATPAAKADTANAASDAAPPPTKVIGGRAVGGMASDEILAKRGKRFSSGMTVDSEEDVRKKQARRERFGASAAT